MNETEFEQYLRIIFTSLNVIPSENDKIDFQVVRKLNQNSTHLPSHTGQQNFSDQSNASHSRNSSRSLDSSDFSSIDSISMFSDINEGHRNKQQDLSSIDSISMFSDINEGRRNRNKQQDLSSIDSISMFSDINEGRRNRDKQQITHLRNLLYKQNSAREKCENQLDEREKLFKIYTQGISKLNEENDALRIKVQEKKNRINQLQTQNKHLRNKPQPVQSSSSSSPSPLFAHGDTKQNQYRKRISELQMKLKLLQGKNVEKKKTVDADEKDREIYEMFLKILKMNTGDDERMSKIHKMMETLKNENNLILVGDEKEKCIRQVKDIIEKNEKKTKAILDFFQYDKDSYISVDDFNHTSIEYDIKSINGTIEDEETRYSVEDQPSGREGKIFATFSERMQVTIGESTIPFFKRMDNVSLMNFLSYILEKTAAPTGQYSLTSSSSSSNSVVDLEKDIDIADFVQQLNKNIDERMKLPEKIKKKRSQKQNTLMTGALRNTETLMLVNLFKDKGEQAHRNEIIPQYYDIARRKYMPFNLGNYSPIINFCTKIVTFLKNDEESFKRTIDSKDKFVLLFRKSLFDYMIQYNLPIYFISDQNKEAIDTWNNDFVKRVMLMAALVGQIDIMKPALQKEYEEEIQENEKTKDAYDEFRNKSQPIAPDYITQLFNSAMLIYYSPSFREDPNNYLSQYENIIANFVDNQDYEFEIPVLKMINTKMIAAINYEDDIIHFTLDPITNRYREDLEGKIKNIVERIKQLLSNASEEVKEKAKNGQLHWSEISGQQKVQQSLRQGENPTLPTDQSLYKLPDDQSLYEQNNAIFGPFLKRLVEKKKLSLGKDIDHEPEIDKEVRKEEEEEDIDYKRIIDTEVRKQEKKAEENYHLSSEEASRILRGIFSNLKNLDEIIESVVGENRLGFPNSVRLDNQTNFRRMFHIVLYIFFRYKYVEQQIKAGIANERKSRKAEKIEVLRKMTGYLSDDEIMDTIYLSFRGEQRREVSKTPIETTPKGYIKRSEHPKYKALFTKLRITHNIEGVKEEAKRAGLVPEIFDKDPDEMIKIQQQNTQSLDDAQTGSSTSNSKVKIKLKGPSMNHLAGITSFRRTKETKEKQQNQNTSSQKDSTRGQEGGRDRLLGDITAGRNLRNVKQQDKGEAGGNPNAVSTSSTTSSRPNQPQLSFLDSIKARRKNGN